MVIYFKSIKYYKGAILMNNKKIAVIISAFIAVLFIIIGIIAIAGHIPFFGKPLTLIFAIILIIFILGFFIIIGKRRK